MTYHGGLALRASIAPAWLASPARVFPVMVDPSYNATTTGTTDVMYPYTNDYSGNTLLQVGTYDSGSNYARSFLAFNGLGSALASEHITGRVAERVGRLGVDVQLGRAVLGERDHRVLVGDREQVMAGARDRRRHGFELDATAPSAACTNTSGNPSVGGWMTVTMHSDRARRAERLDAAPVR